MRTYRNPANGHTERARWPWLWVLLFGVLYFAARGMGRAAIMLFLLAIPTLGIAWVYYILTAAQQVERHYLARGWERVTP